MKREEALRIIKECKEKGFKHTFYTLNEYHTALDIAIKALEQEPCEDVISRWAVLDLAKKGILISNGNYESVCKAINELPSVNLMPCEDAISRQAVLDAIDVKAWEFCDYLISKNRNDEQKPVSHFADNLRECVREELPSVEPQPKTGHWIRVTDKAGHLVWECDKCEWQQRYNTNFCPDCGAKMIDPQESEVEE